VHGSIVCGLHASFWCKFFPASLDKLLCDHLRVTGAPYAQPSTAPSRWPQWAFRTDTHESRSDSDYVQVATPPVRPLYESSQPGRVPLTRGTSAYLLDQSVVPAAYRFPVCLKLDDSGRFARYFSIFIVSSMFSHGSGHGATPHSSLATALITLSVFFSLAAKRRVCLPG
jgi:hypothetical protein